MAASVPSFYIRPKFRLKNQVTTVIDYNIKQISSFFYACKGEIYSKLKNICLGKPPLISILIRLHCLHSSTLIYICLHSSSDSSILVYIRLHSSSDSSTLIYIRLHSSSDSSTLVYIHLHSPSDSSTLVSTFVYTHLVTRLCF